MNDATERPSDGTRRSPWFRLLVTFSVIFGGLAVNWLTGHRLEEYSPIPFPPIVAAGATIAHALDEFNGKSPAPADWSTGVGMAEMFILMFVVVPIAYLVLQERSRKRAEEGRPASPVILVLLVIVSLVGILYSSIVAGTFYASRSVHRELRTSFAMATFENDARTATSNVAFRLREFAVVPVAMGGGGGTFMTTHGPVSLSDLGIQEQDPLGRLVLVPQKSDTMMLLYFLGVRTSGTVILETTISPSTHRVKKLN